MIYQSFFYHQTIKKTVALFGTLFNNITIGRVAGGLTPPPNSVISNVKRVPISYASKSKFLSRISEQPDLEGEKVGIKLPRMSFEMTSIALDASAKLNRLNRTIGTAPESDGKFPTAKQSVPYILGFQLNIYGKNQDDVLQIVEQILPQFTPEYTVSAENFGEVEGLTNVPITLVGVSWTDEYEGDMATSKRAVIYTLDFTIKVKFLGPVSKSGLIKFVDAKMHATTNANSSPDEHVLVSLGHPTTDTPDDFTTITEISLHGFN